MSNVAIVPCSSYDPDEVYTAMNKGLSLLGGIRNILEGAENVLQKPNLVTASVPRQGVTTHPVFFSAVARCILESGKTTVFYGDSPANVPMQAAAKRAKIQEAAASLGIREADFSRGDTVYFPKGKVCNEFQVAEGVLHADAIVSMPKWKTHCLTTVTGAIKNQFGCIYKNKSDMHGKYRHKGAFIDMLIDLNLMLKPKLKLFIMDAIVSMEGEGPYAGDPIQTNIILLSTDPVALDYTACLLVNANANRVPLLRIAEKRGLGEFTNRLNLCCEHNISALKTEKFRLPKTTLFDKAASLLWLPDKLRHAPHIDTNRCSGCAECIRICPSDKKAITKNIQTGKCEIRAKDCIRCYCCHEICPNKAIHV